MTGQVFKILEKSEGIKRLFAEMQDRTLERNGVRFLICYLCC